MPPGRTAVSAFLKLPPAERAVVVRACALFPFTALGIRSLGMRRMQGLLRVLLGGAHEPRFGVRPSAKRTAELVERTADSLRPRPRCLVRSLVIEAMLHRHGEPAVLRLGARRQSVFEAHAWVELDGVALNDTAPSFIPFVTRPGAPPSD